MAIDILPEMESSEAHFRIPTYPGRRNYFIDQASEFILDSAELNLQDNIFHAYLKALGKRALESMVTYPVPINRSRILGWSLEDRTNSRND